MSGSKRKSSSDVAGTAKKSQAITMETKVKIIERVERQEEEVTEEPKRFTTQEMARELPLFDEALLVFEAQDPNIEWYTKVAAAFRMFGMQSSATVLPMMRKKRATTQTSLDCFFKRVDRIVSSKEPEPVPSTSGI